MNAIIKGMDLVPQQPVTVAPSVEPVPTPKRTPRGVWVGVVAGLLLILAAAAGYFYPPFHDSIASALSRFIYPSELGSVRFIAATGSTSMLYQRVGKEFLPYVTDAVGALPPETFAAFEANSLVSIVTLPDGFSALSVDGAQALSSVSKKTTATLSPGTKLIAFAELLPGSAASQVVVFERATKAQRVLGVGHSPYFADDSHVLWFSSEGVMITDIGSGAIARAHASAAAMDPLPVQSPDGTLLAWMDGPGTTVIITRLKDGALKELASYSNTGPGTRLGLGNEALYILTPTEKGTEVWRYSFDGAKAKRIYTFDSRWKILQFIP